MRFPASALVTLWLAAGCTAGDEGGQSAAPTASAPTTTAAPTSTVPLIDVMEFEEDLCVPLGGSGEVVSGGQPGADPYLLVGARQRPGPDMTTLPAGDEVRSVQVARPGDPDADSPAKTPTTAPGSPTTTPLPTTTTVAPPTSAPADVAAPAEPSCQELP